MLVLIALVVALDGGAPPVVAVTVVPAPAPLREAKSILADYAKAIGDEQAWKKHKSIRLKREVSVKSMHFVSHEETRVERGGKVFTTSEMPGMGTFKRGSDGRKAWAEDPIGGLRVLTGAEAEDVRIAATWNSEWRLDKVYAKVSTVPPPSDVPPGQTWECVELSKAKGKPSTLCFDGTTHLRVWERGVQASQGGDVPYVTRFSDWRVVDGVRVWYQEDVAVGPVNMEGHMVEIVFDEPTPTNLFGLPKKK